MYLTKKRICFTLIVFLMIVIFPFHVSANGPPIPIALDCEIVNRPENAAYVDLLIQISESDREYVAYNDDNGQSLGISEQSQIVLYHEDGFASFTFHFAGADASNREYGYRGIRFAEEGNQYNILEEKYHIMKIALLDKDGNILQISDSVDINPSDRTGFLMGQITYDAAANTVDAPYYDSPLGSLVTGFVFAAAAVGMLFLMLISSGIETFIACLFNIRPARKVFWVNILTQIFLNIFMSACSLPYVWALLIGEVIVYGSEFLIFKRIYKTISARRLAVFVVTANTVSLIVGLLINAL